MSRRPRSGRGRRRDRPVRRAGPALVRHADHEPAVGGSRASSKACSETTTRGAPAAGSADRFARISATPSAACSLVPQPVTMIGSPASPPGRIAPASLAAPPCGVARRSRIRRGEGRLGRDHVGHVVRRPAFGRRGASTRPGIGRGGERARSGRRLVASAESRVDRRPDGPARTCARAARRPEFAYRSRLTEERSGGLDAGRLADSPGLEGRIRRLGPGRRMGTDGRARPPGRGARVRVRVGVRPLHTRCPSRATS